MKTFIFIGPSGSGKGTQAELLKKYLKEKDGSKLLYVQTGALVRDFISEKGYSNQLAKGLNDKGERQPSFLAVYLWSKMFIEALRGGGNLIIDGSPRTRIEAEILDTAFEFYGFNDVFIIFMNVSHEWATNLLFKRGRTDDSEEDIVRRLAWYEEDVVPAIEYYRKHKEHTFLEINGEQTVEEVQNEIMEKLKI